MSNSLSAYRRYAVAAGLGALAGGVLVTLAARLFPKTMSAAMAQLVGQIMAQMDEGAGHLPDT